MSADLTPNKKLEIQLKLKELFHETYRSNDIGSLDIMSTKIKQYFLQEGILQKEYENKLENYFYSIKNTNVTNHITKIVSIIQKGLPTKIYEATKDKEDTFINSLVMFFPLLKTIIATDVQITDYIVSNYSLTGFYLGGIMRFYGRKEEDDNLTYKRLKHFYKLMHFSMTEKYSRFLDGVEFAVLDIDNAH